MQIDWDTVGAPLAVGVALWLVAEVVRSILSRIAQRRARRRQIIGLMGRARGIAFRAIRDGLFDASYVNWSTEPTADARAKYDDLTVEALNLFERDEGDVAFWAAAEFYSGWADPFQVAADAELPRKRPKHGQLFDIWSLDRGWELARAEELIEWADAPWPLARGSRLGPRYGDAYLPGDISRHSVVHPNSDTNGDMLLSWVAYLPGPRSTGSLSRRELRRLRTRYPEHLEKYPELN